MKIFETYNKLIDRLLNNINATKFDEPKERLDDQLSQLKQARDDLRTHQIEIGDIQNFIDSGIQMLEIHEQMAENG